MFRNAYFVLLRTETYETESNKEGLDIGTVCIVVWHIMCIVVWHIMCFVVWHIMCIVVWHIMCIVVWHIMCFVVWHIMCIVWHIMCFVVWHNVAGSRSCTQNLEWETSVEECKWQKVLEEYLVNVGTGLNYIKRGPGAGILWLQ